MHPRDLLAVVLMLLVPCVAHPDSIWDRKDRRAAFLFEDNNARHVGDIITVLINESTAANEREERALDKKGSKGGTMAFSANSAAGSAKFDLDMNGNTRRNFNGSAQLTSDRRFLDRITVVVVDVLPNGNLVVEGYRSRIVGGERRDLRITGIVRPADIGAQNTVESRFVANFRITYIGHGPSSRFVDQGWLGRVWNALWPW
jgi:flagellar L-ring protein precursor FlgH